MKRRSGESTSAGEQEKEQKETRSRRQKTRTKILYIKFDYTGIITCSWTTQA